MRSWPTMTRFTSNSVRSRSADAASTAPGSHGLGVGGTGLRSEPSMARSPRVRHAPLLPSGSGLPGRARRLYVRGPRMDLGSRDRRHEMDTDVSDHAARSTSMPPRTTRVGQRLAAAGEASRTARPISSSGLLRDVARHRRRAARARARRRVWHRTGGDPSRRPRLRCVRRRCRRRAARAARERRHPTLAWHLADLAHARAADVPGPFDAIVLAGNVMIFLAPDTEAAVLRNLAVRLAPGGLLVAGFQLRAGGLTVDAYDDCARAAGPRRRSRASRRGTARRSSRAATTWSRSRSGSPSPAR